jgi:hypothetical protein
MQSHTMYAAGFLRQGGLFGAALLLGAQHVQCRMA